MSEKTKVMLVGAVPVVVAVVGLIFKAICG